MRTSENAKEARQYKVGTQHVAIIMDGNGRWAKRRGKLRIFGHKAGVKAVRCAVSFAAKNKLETLTLYAFSRENRHRPVQEVSALMELFLYALNTELKNLQKHNIRLRVIGEISYFHQRLQECIDRSEKLTKHNNGLTVNIAANYGGRWDITQGVKKLAEQIQDGTLYPHQITEKLLSQYVCLSDLAPVDLLIRTGGEHRISDFLLWQIAYSELYFTDVLWPDFDESVFQDAMYAFSQRERRFGKIDPTISSSFPSRGRLL